MIKNYICLLLIFTAACTVGPDYESPQIYEDMQISQSLKLKGGGIKISQQWYEQFNDKNLNFLIESAVNHNSDLNAGIARLRQARITADINRAQYLPMLNADAKYDYGKASKNIGLAGDTNYFQLGLDASWELDIWGAGRRLNEQSLAKFSSAMYSLRNLRVTVIAETAKTYFALKTAQEQLRIAQNNLKLQQDIYRTVSDKYRSGLTDSAAFNQAAYITETTKAAIPALEYKIEAYKNALAVLTGMLPQQINTGSCNPIKQAYKYNTDLLYNLPSDIIRSRPDVKAAERNLAAQNAAIGQAVAELYPNLSISGLFGVQSSAGSKLFNSDSKAYGYIPSAVMPLFNWNKLQNNIELQKQIRAETYETYRQTLLQAVEELGNAITATQKEFAANNAHRNAVYRMRQAFEATRSKYRNGLIEFSDLLKTEQDLLQAETDLAASNGAIYQNIIAFYKATGGGYN